MNTLISIALGAFLGFAIHGYLHSGIASTVHAASIPYNQAITFEAFPRAITFDRR